MNSVDKEIVDEEVDRTIYECVVRLLDKAAEWAEANSEPLFDMLVDQMHDDSYSEDYQVLCTMYRYLLRLILHLKNNPDYSELNRLSVDEDGAIRIWAYDYNTYCWCMEHHLDWGLSNGELVLYKDRTPKHIYSNLLRKIDKH